MAYMTPQRQPLGNYGTFDGLGLSLRRKKKKAPAVKRPVVGVIAPVAKPKKKKKKSLLSRIGKAALKVAPVAAGIFLPGAGAIAVGAASGAIGRGKPKLKRILRGAAIAGGTKIAVNLVKSGQAGRILVKGKNALGAVVRGGGKVIGKVGSTAGHIIENIAKGDIGPAEGAVIGAGGGAAVIAAKKLLRKRGDSDGGDESPSYPIDDVAPPGSMPPIIAEPPPSYPGEPESTGPLPPSPTAPPSPTETPTAGTIPTAGGEVPNTASGALFPGSGGDSFAPAAQFSPEEATEAAAEDDGKKKMILVALGVGAVIFLATRKKGRRT